MTARTRKLSTISVEDVGFFEGAEKLLEMWFCLGTERSREPGGGAGRQLLEAEKGSGLRVIPRYVHARVSVHVLLRNCTWSVLLR